jgi:predicted DNA-binding protein (MmcQ/YjbR family)
MTAKSTKMSPLLAKVRARALAYPETTEEFPWGDRVVKVKGKVFIFMGQDPAGAFGCSLKLPRSHAIALELPFAEPTGYGLGKAGWVSLKGPELQKAPFEMIEEWLDESFRAVAPKKVLALLDAAEKKPAPKPKRGKAREPDAAGARKRTTR